MRYGTLGICLATLVLTGCADDAPTGIANEGNLPQYAAFAGAGFPEIIPLPTGFQPEGIAVGRGTQFFVGSFPLGAIYRGDLLTGQGAVLVPPDPGNRSAVGLSYDARADRLFVAGGLLGTAYVFDAESGATEAVYQLATPCAGVPCTLVNDVVVTKDAAYFTDSFRPFMYRVPLGPAGALPPSGYVQEIPLTGDFVFVSQCPFPFPVNANGIDATPNGRYLVLVNLCTGTLYRVDPASGSATTIDLGGDAVPYGDGIVLDGNELYVVQNFLNQIAVVELAPDLSRGTIARVITHPEFRIPATAAEFGPALYAVNARFDVAPPDMPAPTVDFEVVRVLKR